VQIYLETARLRLRRFTGEDAADLAALHGDPAVMRYIDVRPVPREDVEGRELPRVLREYRELPDGLGHWVATARAGGEFLGWFGLSPASSPGLDGGTEIGYRLRPGAWGRGYATEGARALVRRAFTELGIERVVGTTMTVNLASRRVLEKAGLRLVRTFFLDWPLYLEGAEHGDVAYELTRAGWEQLAVLSRSLWPRAGGVATLALAAGRRC
jgi:RimJ/RimL family protein N-acetyltransferase